MMMSFEDQETRRSEERGRREGDDDERTTLCDVSSGTLRGIRLKSVARLGGGRRTGVTASDRTS